MKLTKREVMLLFVLGTVAILFVGINYLFMPLYSSNAELKNTLATLQDQVATLQVDQQITGSIDGQIEEELAKTEALSEPFASSIRPEQISYWLNSLLLKNSLKMDSIEFTDIASAAPNFDADRTVPPSEKLDLPIQNTADIVNGEQAAAADATQTADAAGTGGETAADTTQTGAADTAAAPETYCTQVILNATGSYTDIKNFMTALYSGQRALTVDTLTLSDYEMGGKMAVVSMRFFGAPLTQDIQGETYDFPAPSGQNALMQENEAPTSEPTEETAEEAS